MPLGPLFFSAGVGTGHTATAPTPSLHISGGGGGSGGGNNFMVRPTQVKSTARPNEIILDPPEGPEVSKEFIFYLAFLICLLSFLFCEDKNGGDIGRS